MTRDTRNKMYKQIQQVRNVSILMKMLFKPVTQTMSEYHCNESEAIERIEKAYDFLKKYGTDYLDTSVNTLLEIMDKESNPQTPEELAANIIKIGEKL
jgi:hypothetical protein